ncbi:hypothetical protein [Victivallis sp. Marseille-Q1083]|uniref:hypothetical protein n=1 Tax=Victivallis sp. Marseille-Q1083 TaxID=2717288 RepID=UPI00158D9A4A|nr:hypothetical protein [Victivallis sp. Marseille-Q1083]
MVEFICRILFIALIGNLFLQANAYDQLQEYKPYLKQLQEYKYAFQQIHGIDDFNLRIINISVPQGREKAKLLYGKEREIIFGGYELNCYLIDLPKSLVQEYIKQRDFDEDHRKCMTYDPEYQEHLDALKIPFYYMDFLEINYSFDRFIAWSKGYYENTDNSFYTYLLMNYLCSATRAFELPNDFAGKEALLQNSPDLWWSRWSEIKLQLLDNDGGYIGQSARFLFLVNFPQELQSHLFDDNEADDLFLSEFCQLDGRVLSGIEKAANIEPLEVKLLFAYLLSDYIFERDYHYSMPYNRKINMDRSLKREINRTRPALKLLPFKDRFAFVQTVIEKRLIDMESSEEYDVYTAGLMTAFIVLGYDFEEETDIYIPNERGQLLLDLMIRYPSTYNARKVKLLYDHGNRELLTGLMKKYGKQAEWEKLFAGAASEETTK